MKVIMFRILFVVLLVGLAFSCAEPEVPALFVFGDSLVDVGNNKYLHSTKIGKANFLPYGIDFPGSKPTGRFSNGYNSADYIAMKLGFKESPPPYLSFINNIPPLPEELQGANFASGGSGILDITGPKGAIKMTEQIEYFALLKANMSAKLGPVETNRLLSKSIFVISAGSMDMKLYDLGARKFAIVDVPTGGWTPSVVNVCHDCSTEANYLAKAFNDRTEALLLNLSKSLEAMKYSLCSTYNLLSAVINNHESYGFTNVTKQCCGYDEKDLKCIQGAHYCPDRHKFLFWDGVHPTDAMSKIAGSTFYDGTLEFASPVNLQQLAQEDAELAAY